MGAWRNHVAPHLWADLAAGRIPERRAAPLEAHANECPRCRRQRDRVTGAVAAFEDIAAAEVDDLGWDHIGARIYWSGSLERRTAEREALRPRSRAPWIAGAVAAAGAAVVALWWSLGPEPVALLPDAAPAMAPAPTRALAVELAPAEPLFALPVLARGPVTVGGEPLDWSRPLAAGARIETGAGELVLQLDGGSGVVLAADTALTLQTLDSHQIELVLERGTITALISPRRPAEELAVVSGGRSVVVRGTGFRVTRDGAELDVRCEHGRVEVTDGTTGRSVGPAQRLAVADGVDLAGAIAARPLDDGAVRALRADLELPLLPAWSGAAAALATSAAVVLEAERRAAVTVDGRGLGAGALTVRLPAGRHQIAVAGHPEWGAGKWLTVEGGGETRVQATRRPGSRAKTLRLEQGRRALAASAALEACVRRLSKQGVAAGSYAVFDLGVNGDGTMRFVSVARSNLGLEARACLLEAAGALRLPPGPAATLRVRWTY